MSCPSTERLAAAAAGEDDDVLAHLDECEACQQVLDRQRSVRDLLGQLAPPPALSAAHRESLAAEVMARADTLPPARRRWRMPVLGAVIAAAAIVALVVGTRSTVVAPTHAVLAPTHAVLTPTHAVLTPTHAVLAPPLAIDDVPPTVRATTNEPPGPAHQDRALLAGDADYAVADSGDRDTVTLAKGALTIDARQSRPVRVITGDTAVALRGARAKVTATRGVIAQVSVFAGSAEITLDGRTHVIAAGTVWERSPAAASLDAFRTGWTALHEGRNADAIAAFDRATDPVVAEDALYWAAVASERTGDRDGARVRYQRLLARFPGSARGKDASTALERLR